MSETRIKVSFIIENQLPQFVVEEFPLVSEFLSQYYISLENQGGINDLLQNIDQYIKVDHLTNLVESTTLTSDVSFFDTIINVKSTAGFPDSYGLLLIDSEIITYTSKTSTTFEGCVRGFSGTTSYQIKDELTFSESESENHNSNTIVSNLSILFLKEFFRKVKKQITPGFEDRELYSDLNQRLFVKQSIDFYSSKGTDNSFKILFGALYGQDVEVIRPRDYLIRPSDAQYRITSDLVVEAIEGNPEEFVNGTLYQFEDETETTKLSQGTITKVEEIRRGSKTYYVISLDSDYDKDIIPVGTVYGKFNIHPKTKLLTETLSGSTILDVESTVGFPNSNGGLNVDLENGTSLSISYESKTLNQFLNCSGIDQDIPEYTDVKLDYFTYAYSNTNNQKIKIRVLGVLSDLEIPNNTKLYSKGDLIRIKTLGIDSKDFRSNNWFFNIPTKYDIKSIRLLDSSTNPNLNYRIYEVVLNQNGSLKVGDSVTLRSSDGIDYSGTVISFNSKKSFTIQLGSGSLLNTGLRYTIKKNIAKVNIDTEKYQSVNKYISNVQNVYIEDEKSIYVSSASLPTYLNTSLKINDRSITFSGSFNGETLSIGKHGLYTGDSIVYKSITGNSLGISTGVYFVKKISDTEVKLARSRTNIFTNNFVTVNGTVTNAKFELTEFTYRDLSSQILDSQKLIRKISDSQIDGKIYETEPGLTGIFINGVELLNYKSKDNIYYGSIKSIVPSAPGSGYDVINPPILTITDSNGSGANGQCSIIGRLERIDILDPGFDYLEDPKIEINGGNGVGASAKVNLISFDHQVSFNSISSSGLVKLNPTNTIGFSSHHKFRDAEEVVYITNSQTSVGGLSTNSTYFVSVQDAFNVKIHKSFDDAVAGINTIHLTSFGIGNHSFKSRNKKKKIGSITIENSGFNYQNKLITTGVSGINTASNTINIFNHGYKSGEIIVYNSTDIPIGGLSSTTSYYVTKINDNEFKLSQLGIGTLGITTSFYYETEQYVNLTSAGNGIHKFNYPEIEVTVKGRIGVSTLSGQDFNAKVQPIFRGEVQSVFLNSGGSNYGSNEILNYNSQPLIELSSGSGIELKPIVLNGQIVDVLVNSPGSGYNSPPNLLIDGSGIGAILTPILSNGTLVQVKVIYGGIGYRQEDTSIVAVPAGSGAKLEAQINSWKVNLVERLIQNLQITEDDGILTSGLNSNYGLQYSHAYAPRKLRSLVQATKFENGSKKYVSDLQIIDGKEVSPSGPGGSNAHSPIIGWAYDGNPIYGPNGYSSKTGGSVRTLKSSYKLKPNLSNLVSLNLRPNYPNGFFVEDYEYVGNGDLDEHNGRFGITPEYPNGVYAYFTTIDLDTEQSGSFSKYKKPVFPYVIGTTYKSTPNEFNFNTNSNQDYIDINQTNWRRNTTPYNLVSYDYLLNPNDIKPQNSVIRKVSTGSIDSIKIENSGEEYKVKDKINFENGGRAKISRIKGKEVSQISVATSSFENVEFYPYNNQFIGFTTIPHNYTNNDLITFTGKYDYKKSGNIIVNTNQLTLFVGVGSANYTGIVTYFNVFGNLNFPNIKENDIYQLGNEEVKILNIDLESSRIRVLRNQNGTIGLTSYTAGTILSEKPRKFGLNFGISTSYNFDINKELYFDPRESVGLGTISGVGIVSTIYFSNPGIGATQLSILTQSIYIKNHNLNTGDSLIYSSNGGTRISISTDGVSSYQLADKSIVYATKLSNDLIGISTVRVGVGSTGTIVSVGSTLTNSILYFTSVGTGNTHSFKTNYSNTLTGQINKNIVTVSTAETHGLSLLDNVTVNVKPGISTNIIIKYDDYNRRLVVNPRNFTSIDIANNVIKIDNHGYQTGQKVIYNAATPASGLSNNEIYYIVVIDSNKIQLSKSYYQATKSTPEVISISTSQPGTISSINPTLKIIKNQSINFDLSDSSLSFTNNSVKYSAFDFKLYLDQKFITEFNSTSTTSAFEFVKTGNIGVDSTAKVTLSFNDNIPNKLYYKLIPINLDINSQIKKDILIDGEVSGFNKISFEDSKYDGTYSIVGISSTSFKYNLLETPESSSYTQGVKYFINQSTTANGAIDEILILNKGNNYTKLPNEISIASENGKNSTLKPQSDDIGKVISSEIEDIGFDYSIDYSVRPTVKFPTILKLQPLSSFDSINVEYIGKNYTIAPSLVVVDELTNKVISDVKLSYDLENSKVIVVKNSNSIGNIQPKIIPINNSNGIKIQNISFNNSNKDVTVTLGASFSNTEDYPFKVGGRVLIEGVSIGVNTTGKGYNSSNYDYTLFTLTGIDPNIGGTVGVVTFNISSYLKDGEYPGTFKSDLSVGKIIPESYFPIFNSTLKKNEFYIGENILSQESIGFVQSWDPQNEYLKISTVDDFAIGNSILGETSGSVGIIGDILNVESNYKINAYSTLRKGWNSETGFLNNDFQRIHDSDYYQYFSYALKTQQDFNTWNNPVSTLNHTAGFKKFGNLILESVPKNAGISTDQNEGSFTGTADLSRFIDLNCVYDFDLARENNIFIDNATKSNQIIFNSRVIQDYIESIGNRVLIIDDISGQFNSNPRSTEFSIVNEFTLSDARTKKYFIIVQDSKFEYEKQFSLVVLVHDNNTAFLNQYGLNTSNELGFFDFNVSGNSGNLLFYPVKSKFNDYYLQVVSFSLNDITSGIGTVNLGDSVKIDTNTLTISQGTSTSTTIVGIASTYRSSKVLVQIGATNSSYYQVDEITILNDGTNIHLLDYGQLTTDSNFSISSSGIGTYNAYLDGSQIKINLTPNSPTSIDYNVNSFVISLSNSNFSGIGTSFVGGSSLKSSSVGIASTNSPTSHIIHNYSNNLYNGSYFILSIEDKTNFQYHISELLVITNSSESESYITEFGVLQTNSNIGIVTSGINGSNTEIYFTPKENSEIDVKIFAVDLGLSEDSENVSLVNGAISYNTGFYRGIYNDIKKEFELKHKNNPIFKRYFDASNSKIVNINTDTIIIPNNFYVTGEELVYSYPGVGSAQAIGIATTSIAGIGTTDKLPSKVYVVRLNEKEIKISASASDALSLTPKTLDLTSVGIGNSHIFTSKNQNNKVIIGIDNVIQTPIVSTAVTTTLVKNVSKFDSQIYVSNVSSIYGGDIIKINNEIMKVTSVGIGTTNSIGVLRPLLGTGITTHSSSSLVNKIIGNYNIVDNKIYFSEAPFGQVPLPNPSNRPDEQNYIGIATGSSFSGRVFLRSGITGTNQEPYSNNYIFDNISDSFNGIDKTFELKSNGSSITGVSTDNAIVLINDIFQNPNSNLIIDDYDLNENSGITTITFTGTKTSTTYDVNTASIPRGGIIFSVGSLQGFGYQPLVSAGGTAVVSVAGTIQSISIGNSGSGYRSGIQTVVNVGVATSSTGIPNIEFIGTASVSNGHIVSVAITNPGVGYTSSNLPIVIFDDPLSYSNIPLIYSSESSSGVGTGAVIDIVVGQGSSIISFELKNLGYGYKKNEILTVSTGGTIGIPTNTSVSFSEFQVLIDDTYSDKFASWTIGELQVIDSIESLFDGIRKEFPIKIEGNQTTIRSRFGSNVDVQATLLVFINDILQVPGEGYIFNGGSTIRFTEAPKEGDKSRILFYKGTADVDTQNTDILESVKIGDNLTLISDDIKYIENERIVTEIFSSDIAETNVYPGPGISNNENLLRPLIWCRQTEDLFINGQQIGKDRVLYESYIQPNTNIIQNIGIGSTIIFVESVKAFFDSEREYIHNGTNEKPQNKIIIISQDSVVSASATALVSTSGTISSIVVSNGGIGYSTNPFISISSPIGFGTTASQNTAIGNATILNGSVTGISVTFGGSGYSQSYPPSVLIETPQIKSEIIESVSYDGDFGIITGISTTSVGVATTGIVFDFFIPNNSILRDSNIVKVGIATTGISGIQTGYYFAITKSNVGKGLTSLNSSGNIVGVGTTFIDNIYQVAAVSIAQTSVSGIGLTNVAKVTVSVSDYNGLSGLGFSGFYGEYSWGRIITTNRQNPTEFISYTNNGGISTSPIVQRFNRLRYVNYI